MSRSRKIFAALLPLVCGLLVAAGSATASEKAIGPCGTASEVLSTPDGSTLVVAETGPCVQYASRVVVLKLDPSGGLDRSFGDGGVVELAKGGATDAVLTSDGKLVVSDEDSIYRLTADGVLDPGFGNGGRVVSPFGSLPHLAAGPEGRLFVSGLRGMDWSVISLASDGSPDASFNGGAPVTVEAVVPPLVTSRKISGPMAADAVGRLYIGYGFYPADSEGRYTPVIGIVRLTASGQPDPSFGDGSGVAPIPVSESSGLANDLLEPREVAVLGDGTVLLLGNDLGNQLTSYPQKNAFMAGASADGGVPGGPVLIAGGFVAEDYVADGGGDVSLAGVATSLRGAVNPLAGRFVGARTSRTGLPLSFGTAGIVSQRIGLGSVANAVDSSADGSLTLGGTASAEFCRTPSGVTHCRQLIALQRFTPSGDPDPGFGRGGVVTLPELDCPARGSGAPVCSKGKRVRPAVAAKFANRRLSKLVIRIRPRKPGSGRAMPWVRVNVSMPRAMKLKPSRIGRIKAFAGLARSAPRVPRRFVVMKGGRLTINRAPVQLREPLRIEIPRNAMRRFGVSIRKRKPKVKVSYGPPGKVGKLFTNTRVRFPR